MKKGELEKISREISTCKRCRLWKTRTNAVPGEGNPKATVFFVGEAPGRNEDLTGKPFVGKAGQILNDLLKLARLERKSVFITSVLKCRPPRNRNPKADEIDACRPFLEKQIDAIKPKVVCGLGNFAIAWLLARYGLKKQPVGLIHGKPITANEQTLFMTYHPANGIFNRKILARLKADFRQLRKVIKVT